VNSVQKLWAMARGFVVSPLAVLRIRKVTTHEEPSLRVLVVNRGHPAPRCRQAARPMRPLLPPEWPVNGAPEPATIRLMATPIVAFVRANLHDSRGKRR
jgi:hypothetical protein